MKTYYILYQITNNLNGKIYVGVHKTNNLDDGYMGSGKVIRSAIEKYGIENFTKVILETFENAEAMYAREKEVVTDEFLAREDAYNLRRGGFGGFDYINSRSLGIPNFKNPDVMQRLHKNNELLKRSIAFDDSLRALGLAKVKKLKLGVYDAEIRARGCEAAQSFEARERRKHTMQINGHSKGCKNSQYGSMWITDGASNKKISKSVTVPEGWRKGRV